MPPVGINEIAELLSVPVGTVRTWRKRRQLPAPDWIVHGQPTWRAERILEWAETDMPRRRSPSQVALWPPRPNYRPWRWDDLREALRNEDDLGYELRARCLLAVDRLEHHVGANWQGGGANSMHPFNLFWWNRAPWTREELVRVAGALDRFESVPQWPKVAGRIRIEEEAEGALLEVLLADSAARQGVSVVLQPGGPSTPTADLLLSNSGGDLFIEVTSIDDFSLHVRTEMAFHGRLFPQVELFQRRMRGGCNVLEEVGEDTRWALEQEMTTFWQRRMADRSAGSLDVPGRAVAWAAPLEDEAAVARYEAEVIPAGFHGPLISDPWWKRLERKVRPKVAQLPPDAQGMVFLDLPELVLALFSLGDLVPTLTGILLRLPRLVGLALTGRAHTPRAGDLDLARQLNAHVYVMPENRVYARPFVVVLRPDLVTTETEHLLHQWLGSYELADSASK